MGQRLAERFPQAEFQLVENARTSYPRTIQRLAELIMDFLSEL
jgi:hypothetical protein